jgi:hypothetical protein
MRLWTLPSHRSLHWAGDHTAFVTHDKLAGAFWSGERAANEIVATITRAPSTLEHAAGVWYHDAAEKQPLVF